MNQAFSLHDRKGNKIKIELCTSEFTSAVLRDFANKLEMFMINNDLYGLSTFK